MKIFLDTNIFLDLLLQRNSHEEALVILNALEKKIFEGFILDITLLNIDYIAKKQVKEIRAFLSAVNHIMHVGGADNKLIKEALSIENNDLEDNVQYIVAKKFECACIVTNDTNFYSNDIQKYTSAQFVNTHINR